MPKKAREVSRCVLVSSHTEQDGPAILGWFEGRQPYESAIRRVIDIAGVAEVRETAHSQLRNFKITLRKNCPVEALERFREMTIKDIGVDFKEVVFEDPVGLFASEQLVPAA